MKRIFCYDFGIAKKNGNNPKYIRMIFELIFVYLIPIGIAYTMDVNENLSKLIYLLWILNFFCLGLDFFVSCRKIIGELTVFALGENGEIYKISKTNNADKSMAVGYYIGSKIKFGDDDSLAEQGAIAGWIYSAKYSSKISKYLNHPDTVNKILENPSQLIDGAVYKFEKIYNIKEKRKCFLIKCDYFNYEDNKLHENENIKLSKSYNCYLELVDIIRQRIDKI